MQSKQNNIPEYVKRSLDYFLAHEQEDPDRYGKAILDLSNRWGI